MNVIQFGCWRTRQSKFFSSCLFLALSLSLSRSLLMSEYKFPVASGLLTKKPANNDSIYYVYATSVLRIARICNVSGNVLAPMKMTKATALEPARVIVATAMWLFHPITSAAHMERIRGDRFQTATSWYKPTKIIAMFNDLLL